MSLPDHKDLPGHESHALVRICRVQGSMNLHGSPIKPLHYMILEVTESSAYHGLGTTRNHPGKHILEIAMSEMQFAELITTPNSGVGTPCTLIHARDRDGKFKRFEEPPVHHTEASLTREHFREQVAEQSSAMKAARRKIENLLGEARVAKKRREEIANQLDAIMSLFADSAPFYMERFEENTEKVIATAKAEITAHADLEAQRVGARALAQGIEVPMLEEPDAQA